MSGKRVNAREYQKLLNKLFLQITGLLVGAVVLVLGIRVAFRGQFANGIVRIICLFGNLDWEEGRLIYWYYIQDNLFYILGVVIVIFFLILLRLAMMLFTRYFDQIISGVDQLSQESDQPIQMCPELGFMADKLTEVQTKLRIRTQQAQAAEQRKNDLVVYLAHDIKTPLTSVIGYLSLLNEDKSLSREQMARYIRIALEKAYRLETLINEFFEITRYRFQSVPLQLEDVDLCYMMVQISDELYPKLMERGKTMELEVPEDLHIRADSDKMARVFNNILKNAIAYSEPASPIRVSAHAEPGRVLIRFTNRGAIPQDRLDDIFEKFYRLDAARSSATGGAGLGLAIARDIVRLHGGEVTARSDGENTVFTVVLPQPQSNQPQKGVNSRGTT